MTIKKYLYFPIISLRFAPYWRRNFLVWKKLAIPSMLGNLADPMLYMLGLGYGLGHLLPQIAGMSYITFLAGGTVCYSAMNSATSEIIYSGFSRMHAQRTWEAVLNAPLNLDDVVLGELIWAASKSFLSGAAILVVIWILGISSSLLSLWIIPLALLIGLCFAAMGLVMTALSPNYDFFLYYFTLVVTPMTLLCGVFFPISQLPPLLQSVSAILPLTHAIELIRPMLNGITPSNTGIHIFVLATYGVVCFYIALVLIRRRLLT
jgi:lipooligosaccharide transport system permease protein